MITIIRKDLFWPKMNKEVGGILSSLHRMPKSKGITPTSYNVIATTTHSKMEVENN